MTCYRSLSGMKLPHIDVSIDNVLATLNEFSLDLIVENDGNVPICGISVNGNCAVERYGFTKLYSGEKKTFKLSCSSDELMISILAKELMREDFSYKLSQLASSV